VGIILYECFFASIQRKNLSLWGYGRFISNDLKYTNLGSVKSIPVRNQLQKVISEAAYYFRVFIDERCAHIRLLSPSHLRLPSTL
jgi:hypothetical protein